MRYFSFTRPGSQSFLHDAILEAGGGDFLGESEGLGGRVAVGFLAVNVFLGPQWPCGRRRALPCQGGVK